MNFLSNLADSLPVVGHVKGVVHYAVGDTKGGNKAMYQATRTSAVLGAGAVGSIGGPGGAALAAMYAGVITDGVTSAAMDKPQGVVKACKNIAEDLKEGKNPAGSIASMGFQVGMDGLGGLGMGGVSSAVKSVGEKSIHKAVKMMGEQVVKKVNKAVAEKAVKNVIANAVGQVEVLLLSAHVYVQADERTKEEEREQRKREEREKKERQRRDREWREREKKEHRERRVREQQACHATEQQACHATEQQEQQAREQQERRSRQGQEQRVRDQQKQQEQRAKGQQVREQQELRVNPERNSGSSQPPRRNRGNNRSKNDKRDYFAIFMILLIEILNDVFGLERPYTRERAYISQIFQELAEGQENYLGKIIERLYKAGILNEVLTIVIRIFSEHFLEDISFPNFLSMLEFVAVYIQEEKDYLTQDYRMTENKLRKNDISIPKMKYEELRDGVVSNIMNSADIISRIAETFVGLKFDIETELATIPLTPNFRDVFSATYHYFKHRRVPGDGVLSVQKYFYYVRTGLDELGKQQDYIDFLQDQNIRSISANIRFEMYGAVFGRWIRIILKFHRGTTVLSSCFFLDNKYDDDEEGSEPRLYIKKRF